MFVQFSVMDLGSKYQLRMLHYMLQNFGNQTAMSHQLDSTVELKAKQYNYKSTELTIKSLCNNL